MLFRSSATPVYGVRMGRLGFLAESTEPEAEAGLAAILDGGGRIEERVMLRATVEGVGDVPPFDALNDVVIGGEHLGRTVSVGLRVDGVLLAEYRADAVIAATATGSTGYALAVGGPILHPTSDDVIVTPVAPHLSYTNALVLPGSADIELVVARGVRALMIVDGAHEQPIESVRSSVLASRRCACASSASARSGSSTRISRVALAGCASTMRSGRRRAGSVRSGLRGRTRAAACPTLVAT